MRFQIDLHLSFGKGDEEQRSEDATGYLADAGTADVTLGFVAPSGIEPWGDEDREGTR